MNGMIPEVDLRPSTYVQDYIVRFYQEAELCEEELDLIRDMRSRFRYSGSLEKDCLELLLYYNAAIVSRFFRWMEFLLDLKSTTHFEGLMKALVFCFKEQKLVHLQTEYQFALSKCFLSEADAAESKYLGQMGPNSFFLCVLISSSWPEIMINNPRNIIQLQEKNGFNPNVDWFGLFFGEDHDLHFLGKHLEDISSSEIDLLLLALSGKSLRRVCHKQFPMSQKEQTLLFSGGIRLKQAQSPILERYIIAARLMQYEADANYIVEDFITQTRIFKNELKTFIEDIEFWQAVVKLLHKEYRRKPESFLEYTTKGILDYLEFQRYVPARKIPYSVKSRTYASIRRDVEEWHMLQDFKATGENLRERWDSLDFGVFTAQKGENHYRIDELNMGIALLKEGRRMKHCVFSYLNSCVNHGTHVFSLKKKKNRGYEHLVTIEVWNGAVTQAHSFQNGLLNDIQEDLLKKWMQNSNLKDERPKK